MTGATVDGSSPTAVIVLITGLPGAGKTTLARAASERFHLPLFCKDDFKERMYEIACPDGDYAANISRDQSRTLGRFSMACLEIALEQCARAGVSAVFEANFDSRLFSPRLVNIRSRHPFAVVQAHLHCQRDVLVERFLAREETDRHPGHGGMRHAAEIRQALLEREDVPLSLSTDDDLITVDTTDVDTMDTDPLYTTIARRLEREGKGH